MMKNFISHFDWLEGYDITGFKRDILAGLTVALVLSPQSMAYAELAGLPPYYGLYASFLPPMIAALFGSSRQLATGPVAVVSLLTATTLEPLATAGSQHYIAYAVLLALLGGQAGWLIFYIFKPLFLKVKWRTALSLVMILIAAGLLWIGGRGPAADQSAQV